MLVSRIEVKTARTFSFDTVNRKIKKVASHSISTAMTQVITCSTDYATSRLPTVYVQQRSVFREGSCACHPLPFLRR